MQQSSWFLAGSSSSQLDLTSSSSYWDHTPSRRRSSATHPDSFTDPEKISGGLMHSITGNGGKSIYINTYILIQINISVFDQN
jgi:hypothetical protein